MTNRRPFMRFIALPALIVALAIPATLPAAAEDCAKEVQAAFEKQRTQPGYRIVTKQPHERGEVETTRDYLAPDKMYNKVVVPGEPAPLETIAIAKWAWANQGGGLQELQPQFAQTVTFVVTAALSTPVEVKDTFTCLGKVKRDGKDYTGYRNEPKAASGEPVDAANPPLVRTVLIDPASGLPALNMVSEAKPDAPAVISTAYSYPVDIVIVAPDAVPAGRPQ